MEVLSHCPICFSKEIEKSSAVLMPFITNRIFGWVPLQITDEMGLRSLKSGTSYQQCATCFCKKCKFIFCDIRFNEEENFKLYHNYRGATYNQQRQTFEADYKEISGYLEKPIHYLDKVESYINSHVSERTKILDWGGDTGKNTPFGSSDIPLFIYDISERAREKSHHGTQVLSSLVGQERTFDLITSLHVFEHLSNPREVLKKLMLYLTKGGYIYLEVPLEKIVDFENPKSEAAKQKYHWHEHINFYSKQSIQALFLSANLKIIDVRCTDVSDNFRTFKIIQVIGKNKTH